MKYTILCAIIFLASSLRLSTNHFEETKVNILDEAVKADQFVRRHVPELQSATIKNAAIEDKEKGTVKFDFLYENAEGLKEETQIIEHLNAKEKYKINIKSRKYSHPSAQKYTSHHGDSKYENTDEIPENATEKDEQNKTPESSYSGQNSNEKVHNHTKDYYEGGSHEEGNQEETNKYETEQANKYEGSNDNQSNSSEETSNSEPEHDYYSSNNSDTQVQQNVNDTQSEHSTPSSQDIGYQNENSEATDYGKYGAGSNSEHSNNSEGSLQTPNSSEVKYSQENNLKHVEGQHAVYPVLIS